MTEREICNWLAVRAIPEYVRVVDVPSLLGVRAAAVKMAVATGALPRAARGTVARSALAVWMARRPDVIAQALSHTDIRQAGNLIVAGCRDDVSVTIRNGKYCR